LVCPSVKQEVVSTPGGSLTQQENVKQEVVSTPRWITDTTRRTPPKVEALNSTKWKKKLQQEERKVESILFSVWKGTKRL